MKTISFWHDDYPRPEHLPVSSLPDQVEVVIVGGGITGLSVARTLAANGVATAVFERERLGWGASSRHGGMATPWLRANPRRIIKEHGETMARRLWQAALEAVDVLAELIADESIDCNLERQGHIILAHNQERLRQLRRQSQLYAELLDYEMPLLNQDGVQAEIGSQRYIGGLLDEWSASLHPTRFLYGLAGAAARRGALLCEKTGVIGLTRERGGFTVHTSQGECKAREVVLATNGYTEGIEPAVRRGIVPVTRYALVTEQLLPEQHAALIRRGRVFSDNYWVPNQFRLTPDGRFLFSGFAQLRQGEDPSSAPRYLRAALLRTFPQLQKMPTAYSWRGHLGMTFDLLPHIGCINGVHFVLGYSGNGLAIAHYLGRELALLLLGQREDSPFITLPLSTRFYYRARPWFLPLVSTYMRWRGFLS
jgi:glycine/D-amino acid oxidase-like deaminating enzyme